MTSRRVFIVGGGPSALTCAWHLLNEPVTEPLEITILQLGWRNGGKGASGRNRQQHDRIEEHGLHIMFGFYQNFFDMITQVYAELDRPPEAPLATWKDAFLPGDAGICMDFYKGHWTPVILELPRNAAVPGRGGTLNDTGTYLGAIVGAAIEVTFGWRALDDLNRVVFGAGNDGGLVAPDPRAGRPDAIVGFAMRVLQAALEVAYDVTRAVEERAGMVADLFRTLNDAVNRFLEVIDGLGHSAHLLVEGVGFLSALTRGLVEDGVLIPADGGYEGIDHLDFADWLVGHGMDEAQRDSIPVRFLYDAAFSFTPKGQQPQLAAGVAVRTLLRMGGTYKGAMYYKMASGMGDVIVAPLVQALRRRGVRFGYFQKLEDVVPHPVDGSIERLRVRIQAEPKAGRWGYEPLFDCQGLPSWPSEPFYDQLVDGDALREVDLESYYATYPTDRFVEYEAGRDFDTVVLATPVPCLPFVAKRLIARSARWERMVREVRAVPTMALQTWFTPTTRELGWKGPASPLLSLFVDPLNTWSEMSQVLDREGWPPSLTPGSVQYFCGPQGSPEALPPQPEDDPNYPKRQHAEAWSAGLDFLRNDVTTLLPGAALPIGGLDWSLLIDPEGREGEARYAAQYVRSNSEPPEWCTLALPGTNTSRMRAGETGFRNLVVCGDWIDNGFYIACLEGAVMGGIHAARAVSGVRIPIVGELLDEGLPFGEPPPAPRPAPAIDTFPSGSKVRVAILGSGVGSMSAAWALAHSPQADRLEITVYQYGWRLGGKGASGRNAAEHDRIQEHGLHIWGGCYENAFQVMRQAYEELGRAPGGPASVWYDPHDRHASAFWPHAEVSVADRYGPAWSFFNLRLPTNLELPGDGRLVDEPVAYLQMAVELLIELLTGASLLPEHRHDLPGEDPGPLLRFAQKAAGAVGKLTGATAKVFETLVGPSYADRLRLAATGAVGAGADRGPLLELLQVGRRAFLTVLERLLDASDEARWMIEGIDLALSVIAGVIEDDVLERGFDRVDHEEFTGWLRRHGATAVTLDGLLVRGWHDFFFAYLNGDARRPSLSAGAALRTIFRYVFTYKGSFFWKMQGGMGDIVFAPLYQALLARGVKFEFFCRVAEVSCVGPDGPADSVHRVRIERQLRLARGRKRYDPLVDVKGMPCWPSEPVWSQLSTAARKAYGDDPERLESSWGGVEPVEVFELEKGRDFDLVVLGLSSKPLAAVCPTLLDRSAAMRDAAALPTNQTLGAQLWLNTTIHAMGWPAESTVGTSYANPQNTWANMDELIGREGWGDQPPQALVYLCGTYTDATPIPPRTDLGFPQRNSDRVRDLTVSWLDAFWGALYPDGVAPGTQGLGWDLLVARPDQQGPERILSQYWRGNIDPSERYVLSPPGTASARRRAWELGFDNCVGAGDWLYTGMMAGCVEGACMGGLQAAVAITGYPAAILGDDGPVFGRGPRGR